MCESEGIQHLIVPQSEAYRIAAQAGKAYVRDCVCRAKEQNCSPETIDVCLLFEHACPEDLQAARLIPVEEALAILEMTSQWDGTYRLFFREDTQVVTEICSCCDCCCVPLRRTKREGNCAEQIRSGYVAVTDPELCVGCGECLESCFFEARQLENGVVSLIDGRCFGCGRCVQHCPEEAISLLLDATRGIPIPDEFILQH